MISENLEDCPLLTPIAYPIRVGSGSGSGRWEWAVGVGSGNGQWEWAVGVGSGQWEWEWESLCQPMTVFRMESRNRVSEDHEIRPPLIPTAYPIRGFLIRSGRWKVCKMIFENLENRPLLTPIAYPIRVGNGSGQWEWAVGVGSGSG